MSCHLVLRTSVLCAACSAYSLLLPLQFFQSWSSSSVTPVFVCVPSTVRVASMAVGEPSSELLKKFSTLLDVIVWAQMPEKLSFPFLSLMGATG